MSDTPKTALVLLFDGVEEIEAITPIDLLRRAGVSVTTISCNDSDKPLMGRDHIQVLADKKISDIEGEIFDCIIIPGGPGFSSLLEDEQVTKILTDHSESKKLIAAICAAPAILDKAGLLNDIKYTAHFSMESSLKNISPDAVVIDQNIITSRGAGTATEFSLKIIATLLTQEAADEVAQSICYHA